MTPPRHPELVYELDVVGQLGPVLRAMAASAAASSCQVDTVMCLRGDDELADILDRFRSEGLEITSIHTY